MTVNARRILIFLCSLYVVRLVFIGTMQLAPDEAFYWYWAKHLDWSYVDHPPMVAYIMALFTAMGGDSAFFVRLGGLLCTILAHGFIFLAARRIAPDDEELAWGVLLVLNATLLFSAGCLIQTPDTPLLVFWALTLYCGAAIATGGGGGWWYLSGIALGLGLLSKYTMILIAPCQLGFLLVSSQQRRWLARKEPYLAVAIALILFSPVLYWNWQHDWISFAFQWNQGFAADQDPILAKVGEYLGGQLGVVTPLLFVAFLIYSWKGLSRFRHHRPDVLWFLVFMSWTIVLFFMVTTAKGEVAEANWPAPAYIAGLLLAWAVFWRHYRQRKGHRRFMAAAVGFGLLLNLVLHIHLIKPIIPIAPDNDTTRQFHGWQSLGDRIQALIADHPSTNGYFLIANRLTTVGEAVFYTGNRYTGIHLFDLNKYTFLDNLDQLAGKDALILLHHFSTAQLDQYSSYFKELSVIDESVHRFRGEPNEDLTLTIARGREFRGINPSK